MNNMKYLLMGMWVGSLIGVLYAPRSGEKTRKLLLSTTNDGREFAKDKIRELQERARRMFEQGQGTIMHEGRTIRTAVEAGVTAYRKERSKALRTAKAAA